MHGTSLVVQWLRLWAPNAEGPGLNAGQGTRSYMPQLKIPQATTKTPCSQINEYYQKHRTSPVAQLGENPSANAEDRRGAVLIPGSARSPGEGNGHPLQYSYLGNPMDRRAWPAAVCGVTKSETQLRDWTTTTTNSKNKAVCIHAHTHTHTSVQLQHTHTHTLLHSSKCLMKMFNFQIRTNCRDKFLRIDGEEDYSQIWLLCSICITKLQSIICHFKSLSTVYLLLLLTWFIKPSYTAVMNACITGHEIKKNIRTLLFHGQRFLKGKDA